MGKYQGTYIPIFGGRADPFLPGIDAFASLALKKASSLPNRTVSSSQAAGASSPSAPLEYNTLTITPTGMLTVNNSTYSAIFVRANVLRFTGAGQFNADGGGGSSAGACMCQPNGGNGASGGGGGAGPTNPSSCTGVPGTGGSGVDGGNGDFGNGGLGLGYLYSSLYPFINGGSSDGASGGPGFGGGGNAAPSELICSSCGGCCGVINIYAPSGGGGAGAGMLYGQFNNIIGSGNFFARGGNPGQNYSGNVFSSGGGGGVSDIASVHKQAGTLTLSTLAGSGSSDGNSRIRRITGTTATNIANGAGLITTSATW